MQPLEYFEKLQWGKSVGKGNASHLITSMRSVLPASIGRAGRLQMALRVGASACFAAIQTLYLTQGLSAYAPSTRTAALIAIFVLSFVALLTVSRLFVLASFRARSWALAFLALSVVLSLWHAPYNAVITVPGCVECQNKSIHAKPVREWGVSQFAFFLHPNYPEQRTLEAIRVPVPLGASTLRLAATKSKDSVLAADGTYLGDGVQIYVTAYANGRPSRSFPPLTLTPSEVATIGWTTVDIPVEFWDREFLVRVAQGPPGSTTLYDSTYIALSFAGMGMQLPQLGGWSFGIITGTLLILIWLGNARISRAVPEWTPIAVTIWQAVTNVSVIAFVACVIAFAAIYQGLSQRLIAFDAVRYFIITDTITDALRSGTPIFNLLGDIVATNYQEYSWWPALVPAVISLLFAKYSAMSFVLVLVIVYLIPTSFACSILGYRLASPLMPQNAERPLHERVNFAVLGAVASLLLAPFFVHVLLAPFPEIGGVILSCAFILVVSAICQSFVEDRWTDQRELYSLVQRVMLAAILAACAFLFRRWYVFLIIGVTGAAGIWVAREWVRDRSRMPALGYRLLLSGSVGLLAFFALMSGVVAEWAATAKQRHYAEFYSGYWTSYLEIIRYLRSAFGIAVPIGAIVICVYLISRTSRALPFLALAGSLAGFAGVFLIQAPGMYHHYLLMPLISGSMAAAAIMLASRWGCRPAVLAIVAAGSVMVGIVRLPYPLSWAVPSPSMLKPAVRDDLPELARLLHWIVANVGEDERYCVVGASKALNEVGALWQLEPSLRKRMPKSLWLGEVDSRDGPPPPLILNCNVMLVGKPAQVTLRASEQRTITIVADALLQGTGIGADFTREGTEFRLQNGVTVVPFRRRRPTTIAQYRSLREEFFKSKGKEEGLYRKRFESGE